VEEKTRKGFANCVAVNGCNIFDVAHFTDPRIALAGICLLTVALDTEDSRRSLPDLFLKRWNFIEVCVRQIASMVGASHSGWGVARRRGASSQTRRCGQLGISQNRSRRYVQGSMPCSRQLAKSDTKAALTSPASSLPTKSQLAL
jgi:hypothetical protein